MQKYKFTYMVEVIAELLTDDKELVKQAEEKSGVKLTYENLETEMGEMILECLADLADDVDISVQPVKHGRWIPQFVSSRGLADMFSCSVCNGSVFTSHKYISCPYKYCNHCGAKMDGGENRGK